MWRIVILISLVCALSIGVLLGVGVSIEVIGFGIGVVGLLISVVAILAGTIQGKKQLGKLDKVSSGLQDGIKQLRGDVQTHYVAPFPDFISEIVKILTPAEEQITIFCDLPAYGVVSSPDNHREYVELIEAKAKEDIPVRMLHLNEGARLASLENQFKGTWAALSGQACVSDFVKATGGPPGGKDPRAGFLARVQERQTETLRVFEAAGVTTVSTGLIMPLYFWIADGDRAVFALTEFSVQADEVGFGTASDKLMDAMKGIFGRYRDAPPAGLGALPAEVGEQGRQQTVEADHG